MGPKRVYFEEISSDFDDDDNEEISSTVSVYEEARATPMTANILSTKPLRGILKERKVGEGEGASVEHPGELFSFLFFVLRWG